MSLPPSGRYSIARIAGVLLVSLVGQGRAIEVGGSDRSTSVPGSEKRWIGAGKRGLPGRGTGALFGLRGATLVRMNLVFLRRVARLDALLTPGMPGVFARVPGAGVAYVRALLRLRAGTTAVLGLADGAAG